MSTTLETGRVFAGGWRDVQRAAVQLSATGEVVAAVSGFKIRVLNYVLSSVTAVNVKWQSATTDKSGLLYLPATSLVSPGHDPHGHAETASGEALNLNLSGSVATGGHVNYVLVPA